jgi:hypothetical protein
MIQFRVKFQTVEELTNMRTWLTEHKVKHQEMAIAAVFVMSIFDDDEAMLFRLTYGEYLEQLASPR